MILFLDTVSPLPKITVHNKNKVIVTIHIINRYGNKLSDCIIPAFIKLQKKIDIKNQITNFLVCTGPGSYTSLRIGIGFLYGLHLSTKIPIISISLLELIQYLKIKSEFKNNVIFIYSSNNQKYICTINSKNKFIIKKFSEDSFDVLDNNKFKFYITNQKLSKKIHEFYKFKSGIVVNFSDIVSSNYNKITSLKKNRVIKPIYISNNKLFD